MQRFVFLLFFILPFSCLAQYTITGRVINSNDKTPVANASVFFNNAVAGSKTDDKGGYTITNVRPGQYDFVVTCLGYETLHQAVTINGDLKLADISLSPKVMMLQEVKIKPKTDWLKNYEFFTEHFFGTSPFAQSCKITTKGLPDLLDLDFDKKTQLFTAKSFDFFEIENKALGYKIKYMLIDFTFNRKDGSFYFEGNSSFEEMKGSKSQMKRWKANRLSAYQGSSMHFLRSVIGNTFANEGFKVMRLIRKPNPEYTGIGPKYIQTLVNKPLAATDFVKLTNIKGTYALNFSDCLYILYNKRRAFQGNQAPNTTTQTPEFLDDPLATTLIFNEEYALFDANGIFANPQSISTDGNWGHRLTAELLPVDYVSE